MSSLKLYQLSEQHRSLEALADSGEVPEDAIRDTLEALDGDIADKVRSVSHMVKHLESLSKAIAEESKVQAERARRVQARADSIRQYLLFNMIAMDKLTLEYPEFAVKVRDNPASVVVDDPAVVPAEFMRQPDPPPPAPDKKAIKEALAAGQLVDGCRLERGQRVEIK